jgi:polygalacturonase
MSGGVRNVFMTDIEIGDVKNALLFKANLDRGGFIESVYVDSVSIGTAAGAVLRFETNYFGYRGGNYPPRYSDFNISNVKAKGAKSYAVYYDGNDSQPITRVTVSNFTVDNAANATYLYKTNQCRFINTRINGTLLPETVTEDTERKQCDVW